MSTIADKSGVQTRVRKRERHRAYSEHNAPKQGLPILTPNDPRLDIILSNVGDLTFRRRILTILEYLHITDDDTILDAGCGEGFYVMLITQLTNARIVGVDTNAELIKKARRWVGGNKQAELRVIGVEQLPFEDKTFSKIICSEVLEHLPDPVAVLQELHRVLKDGGILAITVPNHNYPFLMDPLNWVREHIGLGHFSSENEWIGGLWANHIRLYSSKQLTSHITRGGFAIDDMRTLSHYCVPFEQFILYAGRRFFASLPVPESVRVGMEKFEWRRAQKTDSFHPIRLILRTGLGAFRAVDQLNDRPFPLDSSSVHLAAKAEKQ